MGGDLLEKAAEAQRAFEAAVGGLGLHAESADDAGGARAAALREGMVALRAVVLYCSSTKK